MTKLTSQQLEELGKRIVRVQEMSTAYGTYQSNPDVLSIIDHMSRVAAFLAREMNRNLDGGIEASDPFSYLHSNLSVAEGRMKIIYNETRVNK